MATEVKLPDLGEGIEDAIISRWLFQEGDTVEEGEPLVEIATDKVDTEMPAPVGGVLLKITRSEGEIVPSGETIAVMGEEGEDPSSVSTGGGTTAEPSAEAEETADERADETEAQSEQADQSEAVAAEKRAQPVEAGDGADVSASVNASPVAKRVAAEKGVSLDSVTGTGPGGRITKDDVLTAGSPKKPPTGDGNGYVLPGELAEKPSLVVQRLAALHNVKLDEIAEGRPLSSLTRYDVMSAVESREAGEPVEVEPRFAPPAGWSKASAAPAAQESTEERKPAAKPEQQKASEPSPVEVGADEELVKHTRMRQIIARNMVESAFTAPHVTTMWDVSMAAALAHRKAHKAEYESQGVNLTVTAYLAMAAVAGLRAIPAANAKYTEEGLLIRRTINLGMAVALPQDEYGLGGLIVPVIKNAGDLNLLGMARAINDVANRARSNKLMPDELQGGTFTLTNYGTSGSIFQTPIIAKDQAGILGVGAIEKRAVVVSKGHPLEANTGDYLTFQPMTTLGFSYDHRVLDGATADAFCAAVKEALEGWE